MTLKRRLFLCFCFLCQFLCAQQNPVVLDEVRVFDSKLKNFSDSKSVVTLNDSVIQKNQPSLTSLLNFNTVVYFKENGLGMVSSPSFRGTTAQQTAVIWNGIAINSQLNGQTDFNTVNTWDFNSIVVRAGGGSAVYGSSAIGGTIHLHNEMTFEKGFSGRLQSSYGSFNTVGIHYQTQFATEKFSSQFSVSRNNSDNDYSYVNSDLRNENGQFYNTSYNLGLGYKINQNNFIRLYSQFFDSKRHFSLISPTDSKTMYNDFNTRSLLEWSWFFKQFTSKAKVAFVTEKYRYYENIDLDDYTFGQTQTVITKYELGQDLGKNSKLNYSIDYAQTNGNGSDIAARKRKIATGNVLFKHTPITKLTYELALRKEFANDYQSPVLFSAGAVYSFSKVYKLKWNASSNFRIPTFNDLYWQGAGNPGLKPESSRQAEITNEFTFGNCSVTATLYATKIRDMIRWIPGNGAQFSPENVDKVSIYGAEILAKATRRFGKSQLELNTTYGYTNSKNEALDKQLTYVPFHKATASLGYSLGNFSASIQYLFVGQVFTQSDNNPLKRMPLYHISNFGVGYDFGHRQAYELGCNIQNIGNVNYRSVEGRYMPGRYYNVFLNLKF